MTNVTIARGSRSRGKDAAEKLSKRIDYKCVSRDILLEVCAVFNIPEIKLVRALHDFTSILDLLVFTTNQTTAGYSNQT